MDTIEEEDDKKLKELMKLMDEEYEQYMATVKGVELWVDARLVEEMKKIDEEFEIFEQLEAEEALCSETPTIVP